MPRAEEFDAFYAQTRARLLHLTYASTGDLGAAAAALRDAFAHAWQHWHRLRTRDVEAWVRQEAGRLATLRHYVHLRRRIDDGGADRELLDALQDLSANGRRLLLLQTIAGLDLPAAAREVARTDADALEESDAAVAQLTRRATDLAELERRLGELRTISDRVAMPRGSMIRRRGRRRRRHTTLVSVAASAVVVVGAGLLVTVPPDDMSATEAALDDRRQVDVGPDSDEPDVPQRPGATDDQLLSSPLLGAIAPPATWREVDSPPDQDLMSCQTADQADPRARAVLWHSFRADSDSRQRAAQIVEVSRGVAAARAAYESTIDWYAGCQQPQIQLVDSYRVRGIDSDVEILALRDWGDPVRTLTVAVARSGVVTTRLVHEVSRPKGPNPESVGTAMRHAVNLLCTTSGGSCASARPVVETAPPPTGEGAGFVGVVDLPPAGDLETPWVGTDPLHTPTNPAATLCDQADFTAGAFTSSRSRTFVLPRSELPRRFGLSETLGRAGAAEPARSFYDQVLSDVDGCEERELSATVQPLATLTDGPMEGRAWELTFEISDGETVPYRLGIVRVGARVAQLAFSGTETADMGDAAFTALLLRAGQRLTELPGVGDGSGATGGGGGA